MRSSHNSGVFFRKMKKKPALQAIIDQIMTYTEDELANLTSQPLWIRKELVRMRQNNGQYSLTPDEIADLMQLTSQEPVEASEYEMREWASGDHWLGGIYSLGRSDLQIQVSTGDLILIYEDAQIYVGDMLVKIDSNSLADINSLSKSLGYVTREQYQVAHRARLNNKCI